ncbi:MAG: hypothetical protein CMF27_06385 [Kiritimatiellaceae bacterium]|jgi:methyl-accepting chemotaxis protein|nr:hypothetical protein [Kiritimatiellaceae bacterium]|tara:strand:- start:4292 stop:4795 length:504 start_codon:yes stop_codon:yes gene_type:complete
MRSQFLLFLMIFAVLVSQKSNADLDSSVQAVERARNAIAKAETVVSQIPENSTELDYVVQLLSKTSQDWDIALSSYNDAKICSAKIMETSNESLREDYKALFTVSKQLTETHANAVIIAASYIRLVAKNNLDQLETIRNSIDEISQVKQLVRDNAEYTKEAIAEKYQ